ncbi:MAG: DUF1761 domain-containing protein [Flavobacteriia bacterium]|nr:DUF1761 domain-containing protein [Flavobacteriia bacterium]
MEIDWLAVVLGTVSTFVLGFIWYNPKVFGKAWQKAAGISDEEMNNTSGMAKIFGTSFVLTFIMALMLSYFIHEDADMSSAIRHALYIGLGIVTMALGVNAMYERKGFAYIIINGGYQTASIVIIAVILTVMR